MLVVLTIKPCCLQYSTVWYHTNQLFNGLQLIMVTVYRFERKFSANREVAVVSYHSPIQRRDEYLDDDRGQRGAARTKALKESVIFSVLYHSISMESSSSIVAQYKEPSLPVMNLLVAVSQGKRKGRSL